MIAEIHDERGLLSWTSYEPNEPTSASRYVRGKGWDDPKDVPGPNIPKKTPRLAGPIGPLPR
jgi:hypothetical protein